MLSACFILFFLPPLQTLQQVALITDCKHLFYSFILYYRFLYTAYYFNSLADSPKQNVIPHLKLVGWNEDKPETLTKQRISSFQIWALILISNFSLPYVICYFACC